MKIENLKVESSTLTKESEKVYSLDLGFIKKRVKSENKVKVVSNSKITDIKVTVSCSSCTKATYDRTEDDSFNVDIAYTGSALGSINKYVRIAYGTEGSSLKQTATINLRGVVKK